MVPWTYNYFCVIKRFFDMYVCVCIRVNCNLIRSNQQWSSLLISVALAGTRRRQRVCPAVVVVCLPPADGPRQRRRSAGRRARRPRASISPRGVGVGLESPSRRLDQEAAESDGARQAGSRLGDDDVDGDGDDGRSFVAGCAGMPVRACVQWSVRSAAESWASQIEPSWIQRVLYNDDDAAAAACTRMYTYAVVVAWPIHLVYTRTLERE